jgi:phosphosulfolactate synthase
MDKLNLQNREKKTRINGLNILIDNGYPLRYFEDVMESMNEMIDFVKFGWGTMIVTKNIDKKIEILRKFNIKYFFGGTLFEKFLYQNKITEYEELLDKYKCEYVEISNGTISMSEEQKSEFIQNFSKKYKVFSEVGFKDIVKSENLSPKKWIEYIKKDLESGAFKVITEARESGTSGICRSNGEIRLGLLEEIIESNININDLIFEAPNKKLQVYFINKFGSNCNLANISFFDVISLETLRLGLRSDTFFLFEEKRINL